MGWVAAGVVVGGGHYTGGNSLSAVLHLLAGNRHHTRPITQGPLSAWARPSDWAGRRCGRTEHTLGSMRLLLTSVGSEKNSNSKVSFLISVAALRHKLGGAGRGEAAPSRDAQRALTSPRKVSPRSCWSSGGTSRLPMACGVRSLSLLVRGQEAPTWQHAHRPEGLQGPWVRGAGVIHGRRTGNNIKAECEQRRLGGVPGGVTAEQRSEEGVSLLGK